MLDMLYIHNNMNKYFDNASTSFPKPREVIDAIAHFMTNCGGSYGRSSHSRAFTTTSLIEECRDLIGNKLGLEDGENIAWATNATTGANMIISSLDLKNKRVLVSPLEHNCIMRPLMAAGAIIEIIPHLKDGYIDLPNLKCDNISLAIVNHQSNVNGVIQPIEGIKKALGDIPLVIDTAQSLGHVDVELDKWGVDYAFFTGHKGLLGPTGIGGIYAKDSTTLKPLIYGGTGSNSSSFEMPSLFPEYMETGTYNTINIVGLLAALKCKIDAGHSKSDFLDMMDDIGKLEDIEIFSALNSDYQGEIFSFRHKSIDGAKITSILSEKYGLECRFGLHCSAQAHKILNTTESGTIRVAPSIYHTPEDLDYFIKSITSIIK